MASKSLESGPFRRAKMGSPHWGYTQVQSVDAGAAAYPGIGSPLREAGTGELYTKKATVDSTGQCNIMHTGNDRGISECRSRFQRPED